MEHAHVPEILYLIYLISSFYRLIGNIIYSNVI